MEIKKIDCKQIKQQLNTEGYAGKKITYKELQQLYREHGNEMSEKEFAQKVLGISDCNYSRCKNKGGKVIILKPTKIKLTQGEIETIIKTLKEQGYEEKKITYEELQQLYREHGKGMGESDFAQNVLDIAYGNYTTCKNKRTKVTILKIPKNQLTQEEVETIVETLRTLGYEEKKITYQELQQLYREYGKGMGESDFAQNVLGISYGGYIACKSRGKKCIILKVPKIELKKEKIEKIVGILKEQGYEEKKITYEELQQLYREHGNEMSEKEFAQKVLGISYSNYGSCRNKGTHVIILKPTKIKLTQREIETIVGILKEQGYEEKKITYEELQQLYREYGKGMGESNFAQKVLGLSYPNYSTCKSRGTKSIILKSPKIELTQEEIKAIIETLNKKGYIGKKITYEELQQLYREYGKGMGEIDFAQKVLGISYANYLSNKYCARKILLKDGIVYDKAKEILELYVKNPGFYSLDYIDKICKEYDISIEDFIIYVVNKAFIDTTSTIEAIKRNCGLWIGKMPVSEKFANQNTDLIKKVASKIINSLCYKYGKKGNREDFIQEAILYIIENMGSIEKNYGHDLKLFENIIAAKIQKYCQGIILEDFKITSRQSSFIRINRSHKNSGNEFEIQILDRSVNVEEEVIQSQVPSDLDAESNKCIKLLSQYIESGYDRKTALALTAEEMNIEPDILLEYMQHYLITKGKVKIKPSETVEWNPRG